MKTQGNIGKGGFIQLEFIIEGQAQTQRFIENIGGSLTNLEPPLTQFGNYMLKRFGSRFNKESGQTTWTQLSESTVLARQKGYGNYSTPSEQGPRHKILQWTGTLLRSFTQKSAWGNIFEVSQDTLVFGSALKGAVYHMSREARSRLPRRTVAYVDREDNYNLGKIFHNYLLGLIKRARGGGVATPPAPKWIQVK